VVGVPAVGGCCLQWGPPLTGGNTPLKLRLMTAHGTLQWGPPLTGGNTAPGIRLGPVLTDRCASALLVHGAEACSMDLSRCKKRPLTCMRAVPGLG
jgi:hypothetical protein